MNLGYIDPASGSMILQVVLGGAAAVAVGLKMQWRRFLRLLRIRKPEDDAPVVQPIATVHEHETLEPARESAAER